MGSCHNVLQDISAVLEKHEKAGTGWRRPLDRAKVIVQDIGPLRNRLISSTLLLSTFNVTLAQSVLGILEIFNPANS